MSLLPPVGANTGISETIFSRLHDDIIQEILSRLPVISLLRYKCVSKSWYSLISCKQFAKIHLENSTRSSRLSDHATVTAVPKPGDSHNSCRLEHCPLPALFSEPAATAEAELFVHDIPNGLDKASFVGSSNGLCCLFVNGLDDNSFILWNPSTRKFKKTPNASDSKFDPWLGRYGFGYDESTDDYKIVAVVMTWDGSEYNPVVKIYSLKTNCWKIREDIAKESEEHVETHIGLLQCGTNSFEKRGKFVSGKLHWAARVGKGTDARLVINSFDLSSEAIGLVEQPRSVKGNTSYLELGALGGCLSLLHDNGATGTEIWIWKEYGEVESWAKVTTVPYIGIDPLETWYRSFTPLFIAPDGEVLLDDGDSLCIYNPNGESMRRLPRRNPFTFKVTDVYIQSLVSPYSDGEPVKQN